MNLLMLRMIVFLEIGKLEKGSSYDEIECIPGELDDSFYEQND